MSVKEKILEGKYNYFNEGHVYTEEIFHVERETGIQGNFFFNAEVLSRVKTGEFLKIYTEYEVNKNFDPVHVKITRQLGAQTSQEDFSIDLKTKVTHYKFTCDEKENRFEKILMSTPHIAAPCFLTSMIMVNQKKIDPVQRTPYTLISSNNIWKYKGPFFEHETYLELEELEPQKIIIDGNELKATHCKLLQVDSNGSINSAGRDIWLSKYYYIPYLAKFDKNLEIRIETLKNLESKTADQI